MKPINEDAIFKTSASFKECASPLVCSTTSRYIAPDVKNIFPSGKDFCSFTLSKADDFTR